MTTETETAVDQPPNSTHSPQRVGVVVTLVTESITVFDDRLWRTGRRLR
ncbi:hypothetical protein BC793_104213 [Actinoplanes xinjiangensis]|jgi:hypothetical protein|uniref:Uncharacterized protein n=1 Tax=Actinoplanes xinjiangensis TaxID=512350 RepID=A0A316FPD4_9ACTN|nr:hypothetical protein BC793_104213 [Actinoplanes xinjiangensis]